MCHSKNINCNKCRLSVGIFECTQAYELVKIAASPQAGFSYLDFSVVWLFCILGFVDTWPSKAWESIEAKHSNSFISIITTNYRFCCATTTLPTHIAIKVTKSWDTHLLTTAVSSKLLLTDVVSSEDTSL